MLFAFALAAATVDTPALPRPVIALLWAEWCAPCREEVRALPALTAAVAPVPVVIVAVDANRRSVSLLSRTPSSQKRFWSGSAYALMERWGVEASGLPLAAAFDAAGRVCATAGGGVDADKLRRLLAVCAQPKR